VSDLAASTAQQMQGDAAGTGALRAYQDLMVGSRSLRALLVYELFAAWGSILPGAVGLLLRSRSWPHLLAHSGRGVVWGRDVVIRHPGKMWIGDGVLVDDHCYFDAKGCAPGEFRIEEGALISRGCIVSGKDGPLRIGARVNIGAGCTLYASESLEIGADTMLAADCYIGGGRYDAHGRIDQPLAQQPLPRRGVVIEQDCWLGAGVTVVDGVRIGRGSVVGAGAVVTRDLEPYSIAAGVPARVIDRRVQNQAARDLSGVAT
jgi:acetyltransferase-like isoleucine patch superfamily enzyme